MKVLVAGSRELTNLKNDVFLRLDRLHKKKEIALIISGGAIGIDTLAVEWAKSREVPFKLFLPDWKKYGRGAGLLRNTDMINECDYAAIFWNGESKGTLDTITKLEKFQVNHDVYLTI